MDSIEYCTKRMSENLNDTVQSVSSGMDNVEKRNLATLSKVSEGGLQGFLKLQEN